LKFVIRVSKCCCQDKSL